MLKTSTLTQTHTKHQLMQKHCAVPSASRWGWCSCGESPSGAPRTGPGPGTQPPSFRGSRPAPGCSRRTAHGTPDDLKKHHQPLLLTKKHTGFLFYLSTGKSTDGRFSASLAISSVLYTVPSSPSPADGTLMMGNKGAAFLHQKHQSKTKNLAIHFLSFKKVCRSLKDTNTCDN